MQKAETKVFKQFFQVSISVDPDPVQYYVGPDLDLHCLQDWQAEGKIRS